MAKAETNPDEYIKEVIDQRSLTMEDGRSRVIVQESSKSVSKPETKKIARSDSGDDLD